MNDEINFLYDEYKTSVYDFARSFEFWATHRYIEEGKCYIYTKCTTCKNIRIDKLISGNVTCIYNIKPNINTRCHCEKFKRISEKNE
jgi:hypothetical protein